MLRRGRQILSPVSLIVMIACTAPDNAAPLIVGEWWSEQTEQSGDVPSSEYGPTEIRLVFEPNGRARVRVLVGPSPGGSGEIVNEGTYEFDGSTLTTSVINDGIGIPVRFESLTRMRLIGSDGEVYHLRKVDRK